MTQGFQTISMATSGTTVTRILEQQLDYKIRTITESNTQTTKLAIRVSTGEKIASATEQQ